MNNLQEQFGKIISEDLPNQVGEELKKVLQKAEDDANRVVELEGSARDTKKQIKDLTSENSGLHDLVSKNLDLSIREDNLITKVQMQKEEELNVELAAEKHKVAFAESLLNSLVRNTTYRSSMFGNTPGGVDQHGVMQFGPTNEDSTKTAE